MIVDTSAVIAILVEEEEADGFTAAIVAAGGAQISAGSWIELSAVFTRSGREHLFPLLQELVQRLSIVIAPISARQGAIGHEAYRRFGTGSGHRARLNLGDCFSYALAKETGAPLLFKGDDFTHTDVTPALR